MIDLTSEFGQHVAKRLAKEQVVWLTVPSAILMGWLIQKGIERSGGLDIDLAESERIS